MTDPISLNGWQSALLALTSGGLARLPFVDWLRLRSEHHVKSHEAQARKEETAGTMALGLVTTMRGRIETLEQLLEDRDDRLTEREAAYARALEDLRNQIHHLEARFATMTVIAEMDPGPHRDRLVERMIASFIVRPASTAAFVPTEPVTLRTAP